MFSKDHHAQFISGKKEEVWEELEKFLSVDLGFKIRGNPDVLIFEKEGFGIEDSKFLKSFQQLKATGSLEEKIIIVSFFSITTEAQNALLKMFEEPTQKTRFFVIAPSVEILIPTLRSRFQVVDQSLFEKKENEERILFGRKFLASNISQRISLINEIIEEKDKEKAIELLDMLELALYKSNINLKKKESFLSDILDTKKELRGRSPVVKVLLEHTIYTLPVID